MCCCSHECCTKVFRALGTGKPVLITIDLTAEPRNSQRSNLGLAVVFRVAIGLWIVTSRTKKSLFAQPPGQFCWLRFLYRQHHRNFVCNIQYHSLSEPRWQRHRCSKAQISISQLWQDRSNYLLLDCAVPEPNKACWFGEQHPGIRTASSSAVEAVFSIVWKGVLQGRRKCCYLLFLVHPCLLAGKLLLAY